MVIPLSKALRPSNESMIAFTGAGGKTTAMFQLARELSKNTPVLVTASSHLGVWQVSLADRHVVVEPLHAIKNLNENPSGITLITGAFEGDRTKPINDELLAWLSEFCKSRSFPLLIEADGSRQKPLKAWAEHEPPIPKFVDQVVHVAGLGGLGKPLHIDNVHRPEIFSHLGGIQIGEIITPEILKKVLTHREGGLKNIPSKARRVILLNQADTTELQSVAHGMAHDLLSQFHSVVVANLQQEKIFAVHEPVAGIILAAGGSTRFGSAKQLLDWKGRPFVHAVAMTALEAGLSPVIVVVGANAEQIETVVQDLNVKIVRNENWKTGQASSIREGVRELADSAGACIFLLVDQPQVNTSILRALVEKHAEGLYPVVAPMVLDQRANPVLFDQETFSDLMKLEGDVGGRAILHKHRMEYLPWHDNRLLLDVDTPKQYQRLISDETL